MPNYSVQLNQLAPNTTFLVRGVLAYSRLAHQIDGEELQKDQTRRQQKGWIPIDKPYTTATINNAQVLYASGNPQQKTPAEIYAEEHFFQSRSAQAQGWSFTGNNKGKVLPWIAEMKGKQAVQVVPEGELANGLDVTLVMRVFRGKGNNGLSLDGVIVNEPIRYYTGGATAGLADLGITFVPAAATSAPAAPASAPVAAPAPAAMPAAPAAPAQTFPPAGSAYNYPVDDGNPFAAQPMTPFATPQGGFQPAPKNPQGGFQPAQPQQGIRYDANDRRY